MRDPLVQELKAIRERHRLSQAQLAERMGISAASYRHIESGRRPLPDYRHGLVRWILTFEQCVGATRRERADLLDVMSQQVLREFQPLVDDLRST